MKRNSKLLAFVIAFAMVLSLAVVPVSADDAVNMVGTINGITDNVISQTPGVKATDGEEPSWVIYEGAYADVTLTYNADGSVSVDRPKKSGVAATAKVQAGVGIRYENLGLESGRTYEISCEIMADKTLAEMQAVDSGVKATHFAAYFMYQPITDDEGTRGTTVRLDADKITFNSDTYTTLKSEVKIPANETGSGEYGVDLVFQVTNDTFAYAIPYRIKNVAVYDVTPEDPNVEPCEVTTDLANYASGVSVNPTIKYTFSNPMPELTAENFVVSEGTIPTVTIPTVTKNDDGSYEVALSGLANETEYTITLTDVKDDYDQSVANTLTFLTEGFRNYDFETFTVDSGNATTKELTEVDGEVYDGTKSLKIVTVGGKDHDARFHNAFKGIVPGKDYIISFYAKAAEGSTNTVKFYLSGANTSGNNNNINLDTRKVEEVEIVDSEWRKVTCYITVKDNAGKKNMGIHMGAAATQAGTYYVDNFEIHEASKLDVDEAIVSLANTNKDNGLELTLYSAEAKTIYFAAAKYADGQLSDIKLDTVELTGAGTQTVTLSGVTDEYKIFVWDSNLTPLNSVLSLSDF